MFIDAHTHAFRRDDLAVLGERLVLLDSSLDDTDPHKWQLSGNGTLRDLVKRERAVGADRFILLPMTAKTGRIEELNRWAAKGAAEYPEVIPFAIMHPAGQVERDLELALDLGLKGVKLHPYIQRFDLGHPGLKLLLELVAEAGLPVILDTLHLSGLLAAKPHLEPIVKMLNQRGCEPEEIAALASAHPRVRIIAAHGGSLYGWHRLGPLMGLDNVYFDLSYLCGLIDPGEMVKIIREKGVERVIYGSDAPWRDPAVMRQWFEDLDLSAGEREQIAAGNIMSLLG